MKLNEKLAKILVELPCFQLVTADEHGAIFKAKYSEKYGYRIIKLLDKTIFFSHNCPVKYFDKPDEWEELAAEFDNVDELIKYIKNQSIGLNAR